MSGRGSFPPAERLYEHAGFLRALARSLLLDEGQADDVVQQTLLAALERPPADEGQPRAWLSGVAKNLARMKRRGEGRRAQREQSVARREGGGAPADEILARLETQRRVVDAVMALDEPYRTAIVFRYFDDLRPQDIAARLEVPVGTIKTRLKRALKMLRDRLDEDVEGGRAVWAPLLLPLALPRTAPVTVGAALLGGILTVKTLWLTAAALVIAVAVFVSVQAAERNAAPRAERHATAPTTDGARTTPENANAKSNDKPLADGLSRRDGAVKDGDGNAVEGARVIALRWTFGVGDEPTGVAARSGADGTFALRLDPERNVKVRIEHPEYQRAEFTMRRGENPDFVLERGTPLRVLVLAPDGTPLAGARVEARAPGWVSRWGPWGMEPTVEHTIYGTATTDESGAVSVAALPPGNAVVQVDYPRLARAVFNVAVAGPAPLEHEVRLTAGGTIRGRITGHDGAPVAGARVYRKGRPHNHALSGPDGRYVLRGVQAMSHEIRAEAAGHGPAAYGAISWGKAVSIPVREGETLDEIDIQLAPETRVRGRVVDADGNGVPDVFVLGQARVAPGGRATGKTDANGRFDVGPLALCTPAPINVLFAHARVSVASVTRPVVAPSTIVDLGDLRTLGSGRVTGRIVSSVAGTPYVRAERPGGRYASYTGRVDAEGKFALRLPAGPFRLTAEVAGRPEFSSMPKLVDVPENGEVGGVALEVTPAFDLGGSVRTEAGGVIALQKVIAQRIGGGEPLVRDAWSNRDGEYLLEKLPAGRYKVGLSDPGRLTQEAVFLPRPEPRTVDADSRRLDLVLPLTGTIVEGRVVSKRDGQPVRDFEVTLTRYRFFVPQGGPRRQFKTSDGRFRIAVPEAGTWAVAVRADGHAPFLTRSRTIAKGDPVDLGELSLGDAGGVVGVVHDAAGQPVRFARVYLLSAKLETAPEEPLTDPRGRFTIGGVVPGAYTVFVVTPHHPLGILRGVTVNEAQETTVAVDLPVASPLTITVTDDAGRPIAGAKLIYTFEALRPLHSGLVAMYEPASFGANTSDVSGRIVKPYVPAGKLQLRVTAKGYAPADKIVELEPGAPSEAEITLVR